MSTDVAILPHDELAIFDRAIEGLIKGYSHSDLVDKISGDWNSSPIDEIGKIIKKAAKAIREETLVDLDKVIAQHIELYEQIYQEADGFRLVPTKLKAMKAKEKLVGMHREQNLVEVYNETNIESEVEIQYDLNKLTKQETERLNILMQKIER